MDYKAKIRYQDKDVAESYDAARFHRLKGRLVGEREISLITKGIAQFGLSGPLELLDLPCGTGRLTQALSATGHRVTGVDISPMMLSQARQRLSADARDATRLIVGDAESLEFDDDSFDLAISLRLFGHLPPANRMKALKELARVSKIGVVVAYYEQFALQGIIRSRQRKRAATNWHPATSRQIASELDAAGLSPIRRSHLLPLVSETLVISARKASFRTIDQSAPKSG